MKGEPEKKILEAIATQKERNQSDRERPAAVGPTTMPEDIPNVMALHNLKFGNLPPDAITQLLFAHGILVSGSTRNAVHIATDSHGVSHENERQYLPPLIHGMVSGVYSF